jgi:hypothetical protein
MSRWSPLLTVLALSLVTPACSSSNDESSPSDEIADQPSDPTDALKLAFTDSAISLGPGESRSVGVQVWPAGAVAIRLSLVGDSDDAFLNTGVVNTDASGAGSFTLTAPSGGATFGIRATVGSASAMLNVSVVVEGVTGLSVWTDYKGKRKVESWTVTVSTDGNCKDEAGVVHADGPFVTEGGTGFPLPHLEEIPVGVPLKVTVRAGHFVGGCTDTQAPLPFIDHLVYVAASDRPLQLGNASIRIKLGLDAGDGWGAAWSDVVDDMVDRFVAKKSDSAALLDAMYAACHPTAAPAFLLARGKSSWDLKLSNAFDSILGVGTLTRKLRNFLTTGVGANGATTLDGSLVSTGSPDGKATLSFSTIGGVPAEKASLSSSIDVTWTSGAGDRVLFGGSASFQATSLAAELGQAVALAEVPSASSFVSSLAKSLSCEDVASILVGSTGSEFAYGSCGEFCVVSLCETALESMWDRAIEPSASKSQLELSANGTVTALSDTATPLDFKGSWVGTTTVGGRQARVSGAASGTTDRTSVP